MEAPVIAGFEETAAGRDAVALAAHLAQALDAPLIIVHAYRLALGSAAFDESASEEAGRRLSTARDLVPPGVAVTATAIRAGSPAPALDAAAEQHDARMIVVGSAQHGALGLVTPGSVAERLLQGAPCAVLVAPRGWTLPARNGRTEIGVAFDGSPESDHALAAAELLAVGLGRSLRIIQVVEPLPNPAPASVDGLKRLEHDRNVRARLQVDDAVARTVTAAHPSGQVLNGTPDAELAAESAELGLLVCGSRGYGAVRQVLLGGVSGRLTRLAVCPLLVVPREAEGGGAIDTAVAGLRRAEPVSSPPV